MFDNTFLQARPISADDIQPNKPVKRIILAPKQGHAPIITGVNLNFTALSTDRDGQWIAMEYTLPPHSDGTPLHRHINADEAYYVVCGKPVFHFDNHPTQATEGSFIYVPKGTAHTFSNPHDEPSRVMIFMRSAGMERGGSVPIGSEMDFYADQSPLLPCA